MAELTAEQIAAIRARHDVPGVFRLPKREDGLGVQGHRVLMEFEGDLWVVLDANTHHPSAGKITAAAAASFADIPALLSHADALAEKVARLERERDFVRSLKTSGGDIDTGTTYVQINPRGCKVAGLFGDVIDKRMKETAHVAHDD